MKNTKSNQKCYSEMWKKYKSQEVEEERVVALKGWFMALLFSIIDTLVLFDILYYAHDLH